MAIRAPSPVSGAESYVQVVIVQDKLRQYLAVTKLTSDAAIAVEELSDILGETVDQPFAHDMLNEKQLDQELKNALQLDWEDAQVNLLRAVIAYARRGYKKQEVTTAVDTAFEHNVPKLEGPSKNQRKKALKKNPTGHPVYIDMHTSLLPEERERLAKCELLYGFAFVFRLPSHVVMHQFPDVTFPGSYAELNALVLRLILIVFIFRDSL
jgi:hypothetical protein